MRSSVPGECADSAIWYGANWLAVAKRVQYMEMMLIRLLHLLADHPDFAISEEEMQDIAKYIQFYLSLVANADTISLLYHLSSKGKTVRDADSQDSEVCSGNVLVMRTVLMAR